MVAGTAYLHFFGSNNNRFQIRALPSGFWGGVGWGWGKWCWLTYSAVVFYLSTSTSIKYNKKKYSLL